MKKLVKNKRKKDDYKHNGREKKIKAKKKIRNLMNDENYKQAKNEKPRKKQK